MTKKPRQSNLLKQTLLTKCFPFEYSNGNYVCRFEENGKNFLIQNQDVLIVIHIRSY